MAHFTAIVREILRGRPDQGLSLMESYIPDFLSGMLRNSFKHYL